MKGLQGSSLGIGAQIRDVQSRLISADFITPPSAPARLLLFIFYVATVIFGRNLFVNQVGQLYIAELMYVPLFLLSLVRLRAVDLLVLVALLIFVGFGTYRHGSFFWAVKDSMMFWYMPLATIAFVSVSSQDLVRIWSLSLAFSCLTFLLRGFRIMEVSGLEMNQYNLAALYLLVIILGLQLRKWSRLGITLFILASVVTATFKTYFAGLLLLALLLRFRESIRRYFGLPVVLLISLGVLALATDAGAEYLMRNYVDALNSVAGFFYPDKQFNTTTVAWRSVLWGNVVTQNLEAGWAAIIFGSLPGRNILADSGFLREGIGLDPRSSHNIFVDLFGYFGITGLIVWCAALMWRTAKSDYARVYLLIMILFSMTNTLFTRVSSCLLAYFAIGVIIRADVYSRVDRRVQ